MNDEENVKYLLKHYFSLRENFPIEDGLDIAPSWEIVIKMRTFQQIELLEKIRDDKKFHKKLPKIILYAIRDLLNEIDKEKFLTAEDI